MNINRHVLNERRKRKREGWEKVGVGVLCVFNVESWSGRKMRRA